MVAKTKKSSGKVVKLNVKKATSKKPKPAGSRRGLINPKTKLPVLARCQTYITEEMEKELRRIGEINCVCRSELVRIIVREWLAAYGDGKAEVKIKPMHKTGKAMIRVQLHLTDLALDQMYNLLAVWVDENDYYIPAERLKAQLLRQMFDDWVVWEKHKMATSSVRLAPLKKAPKKRPIKKSTRK